MNSWKSQLASIPATPGNLLIVGLIALLLAGYATDWKIVFRDSPKPKPEARFGATEAAVGTHRMRLLRLGYTPGSEAAAGSEVADSRSR